MSNPLTPATVHSLLEKTEFVQAHACALKLFAQQPQDYDLGLMFLRAAILIERVDSVVAALHDLSARIPERTFHLLSFQAQLCLGHFSQAWQHLHQVGFEKDSLALHESAFRIASQEYDLPAALANLTAIERLADQPLQHFFRKFEIWKLQGNYAQIEQQLNMLQAEIPQNLPTSHMQLRLWRAGIAHSQHDFAASLSITQQVIADLLARPLAQAAHAGTPALKPWTRQRQHQVMKDLERVMLMYDLPLFMVAGSLLSLVRDGDFFLSDKDMDVGLLDVDFESAVRLLVNSGYFIDVSPPAYFVGYVQLRHRATGFTVDVTHYRAKNQQIHAIWAHVSGEILRETVFAKFALREAYFPSLRCRVLVPDQAEVYLTNLYGDWRTPDPDFDTVVAARNLSALTPFLHSLSMLKIADAFLCNKRQKLKAVVRHLQDCGFHSALLTKLMI